jgi:hypothetical protein
LHYPLHAPSITFLQDAGAFFANQGRLGRSTSADSHRQTKNAAKNTAAAESHQLQLGPGKAKLAKLALRKRDD